MPDYLHLSSKGYRIWADAMEPTLWSMLDESVRVSRSVSRDGDGAALTSRNRSDRLELGQLAPHPLLVGVGMGRPFAAGLFQQRQDGGGELQVHRAW